MPSRIPGVGRIVSNTRRVGNILVEHVMCPARSALQCSNFLECAVKFELLCGSSVRHYIDVRLDCMNSVICVYHTTDQKENQKETYRQNQPIGARNRLPIDQRTWSTPWSTEFNPSNTKFNKSKHKHANQTSQIKTFVHLNASSIKYKGRYKRKNNNIRKE